MSTRPRTPDHFPRMKHRAAARLTRRPGIWEFPVFTFDPEVFNSLHRGLFEAAARLYPFAEALAAAAVALADEPECSVCEHVHDVTNTACSCCVILGPDIASVLAAHSDILTLHCMAAQHDACEGDFCECACHDTPTHEGEAR